MMLKILCPACSEFHKVPVGAKGWDIIEKPHKQDHEQKLITLMPSVRVRGGENGSDHVCHFHLIDGVFNYCGDSTHQLSGQKKQLEVWEYE